MENVRPGLGDLPVPLTPRILLAFSSFILAFSAFAHGAAFRRAVSVIDAGNVPPMFGNSFKVLWLADSTTCLLLAVVFAVVAARPSAAAGRAVTLVALVPGATGVLIYVFLGGFYAGHLLLAAAAAAFLGGLRLTAGGLVASPVA